MYFISSSFLLLIFHVFIFCSCHYKLNFLISRVSRLQWENGLIAKWNSASGSGVSGSDDVAADLGRAASAAGGGRVLRISWV